MTSTSIPPGIYRIVVAGELAGVAQSARLTRDGEHGVTILPPSAERDPEQEWRISAGTEGNILIERPSKIFPTSYLTYEGSKKEGDRIVVRLFEFPLHGWHVVIAPGFRSLIRVAGSDLGIRIAPPKIYPPILELGLERQLEWVFERVLDE